MRKLNVALILCICCTVVLSVGLLQSYYSSPEGRLNQFHNALESGDYDGFLTLLEPETRLTNETVKIYKNLIDTHNQYDYEIVQIAYSDAYHLVAREKVYKNDQYIGLLDYNMIRRGDIWYLCD